MLYLDIETPETTMRKHKERACLPVSDMFGIYYEDFCWEDYEYIKYIVSTIDRSEMLSPMAVKSPVFDVIPVEWLSNGSKSLILIHSNLDFVYSLDFMGDNCFEILFEIANTKDVYATISAPLRLYARGLRGPVSVLGNVFTEAQDLNEFILKNSLYVEDD